MGLFDTRTPQTAGEVDKGRLPRHIAVIMDGNGRWRACSSGDRADRSPKKRRRIWSRSMVSTASSRYCSSRVMMALTSSAGRLLIIRPSGELRLSNFLLWQCAYSEFYFCDTLWPDFDEREFDKALIAYQHRERRFGGVKP